MQLTADRKLLCCYTCQKASDFIGNNRLKILLQLVYNFIITLCLNWLEVIKNIILIDIMNTRYVPKTIAFHQLEPRISKNNLCMERFQLNQVINKIILLECVKVCELKFCLKARRQSNFYPGLTPSLLYFLIKQFMGDASQLMI